MYEFKDKTAITASLDVQIHGVPGFLNGVPLTVSGDQQPQSSRSEVVVTWEIGTSKKTVLVPVHRIDSYSSFWINPESVV